MRKARPAASPAKLVSASASSTNRARRGARLAQRRRDQGARRVADAGAGAEKNGVAPGVGEERGELGQAGKGRDHHRGRMGGVDEDRVGRAGERDEPGADPQGGARGEPRRAGAMRRAGEDERGAARIFVRGERQGAAAHGARSPAR